MMYLRHEAGHAFNYAYVLYESERVARDVRSVLAAVHRGVPPESVLARLRAPHRRLVRAETSR